MIRFIVRAALVVASLGCASAAGAGLRSPQIPVSGSALQNFFASKGQLINVNTDQLDLQTVSFPPGETLEIHAAVVDPGSSLGLYNAGMTTPPLYQVFPGAAADGWYAVASFRAAPTRLVVSLYDNGAAFVGTTTYIAGPPDPAYMGLYLLQAPGASGLTFYSQDERNADGARMLAFNGKNVYTGYTWLAWETGAGPGGDFADSIWLFPYSWAPVPVNRTDWGTLKARFR